MSNGAQLKLKQVEGLSSILNDTLSKSSGGTITGPLIINSALSLQGAIIDYLNSPGNAGQILSSTGTHAIWIDAPISGNTGIKNVIDVGETINIKDNFQYLVVGDFYIDGDVSNDGEIIIIDGSLEVGPNGSFTDNGRVTFIDLSAGTSGYSGFSGINGTIGSNGTSGLSGYSGISGFSGNSTSGFSGYSGISGLNGQSGYSGISGFSGANGTIGSNGASGFSGYSGISGFSGANGTIGASGFSGVSGYSGVSGFSGISGYSGISGFSAYSGVSGFSGINGSNGASGFSGYSGISGINGASGFSGTSGYSGSSGISGFSGISGYSGVSGFSGVNGTIGSDGASGFSGVSGAGTSGYSGYSGNFPSLPGTGSRVAEADPAGVLTASKSIIDQIVTDSTLITGLQTSGNWIGTPPFYNSSALGTPGFQGQMYFGNIGAIPYWFFCKQDGFWIRESLTDLKLPAEGGTGIGSSVLSPVGGIIRVNTTGSAFENSTFLINQSVRTTDSPTFVSLTTSGSLIYGNTTATTISASQNNYSIATAAVIRISSTAVFNITGMITGAAGRSVTLYNVGSFNIVFTNEDTNSTAANRITLSAATSMVLLPNTAVTFTYDSITSRWRNISSSSARNGVDIYFSHASFNPLDATDYFIGNTILSTPSLTSAVRFRMEAPITGVFDRLRVTPFMTTGTTENSTLKINNLTAATSVTISAAFVFDNNIKTYTGIGLAVTVGDEIELQITTATWTTNPTEVVHYFQGFIKSTML